MTDISNVLNNSSIQKSLLGISCNELNFNSKELNLIFILNIDLLGGRNSSSQK
jgi:hypothetical protein